ncbi:MAG: FkbM family methyltransferase [Opitutaceae bacterium]|nr:FkbM family methyltransferase [Opitutaceae bacterium]
MSFASRLIPFKLRKSIFKLLSTRSLWLSQAGQDFWVSGEAFNGKRGGYFLDIGAHDGITISNTFILERKYAWKGICVEANPSSFSLLLKNREAKCLNICLDSKNGEVEFALGDKLSGIVSSDTDNPDTSDFPKIRLQTRVINDILAEHNAPSVIDYLSIDVEGAEDRVLSGLDWKAYRFNCVTIERPSQGLRAKFSDEGYVLVKDLPGLDAFFVHKEFIPTFQENCYGFWNSTRIFGFRWS